VSLAAPAVSRGNGHGNGNSGNGSGHRREPAWLQKLKSGAYEDD
jgi:hypothetical protein